MNFNIGDEEERLIYEAEPNTREEEMKKLDIEIDKKFLEESIPEDQKSVNEI